MKFLGLLLAVSTALLGQNYHNQKGCYSFEIGDEWTLQKEHGPAVTFTSGERTFAAMGIDFSNHPECITQLQEQFNNIASGATSQEELDAQLSSMTSMMSAANQGTTEISSFQIDTARVDKGILGFSIALDAEGNQVAVEMYQVIAGDKLNIYFIFGNVDEAELFADELAEVVESSLLDDDEDFSMEDPEGDREIEAADAAFDAEMADEELAVEVADEESAVEVAEEELAVEVADEELAVEVADEESAVEVADEELAVEVADEESAVEVAEEELAVEVADEELAVEDADEELVVDEPEEESFVEEVFTEVKDETEAALDAFEEVSEEVFAEVVEDSNASFLQEAVERAEAALQSAKNALEELYANLAED